MIQRLLICLLFSCFFGSSLQAQIFSEDFNSASSFSNWTLINLDGLSPAPSVSRFTDAWILSRDSSTADSCASSTSWYSPSGQANDWMISPPITLSSTSILSWEAQAQDNRFPDGYEVRISTNQPTITDFNINPPLFSILAENSSWTRRSLNLAAQGYSNQTVYLAWRNNTNDQFILNVDNINVDSISGSDANMITALNTVDEFWQVPIDYTDSIRILSVIENVGADTLFGLRSVYEIYRDGSLILRDSTPALAALPPADTAIMVATNSYWPTISGDYNIVYYPTFAGTDVDSSNNFYFTDTLSITDSTYARDNDNVSGQLGIGSGVRGEIGTIFNINRADSLTSVSIYITNANGTMSGQPISLNIRPFNNIPGSIIASSDTITYSATGASWIDFSFDRLGGYVPLNSGPFFIGVVEPDSNLTLGTTPSSITPNVNFVDFPNNPQNGWGPLDAYNIFTCLMIRPNFGPSSITVSLNDELPKKESKLKIYPNPSTDGLFYLEFIDSRSMNLQTLRVFDLKGDEVRFKSQQRGSNSYSIDLGSNASGIYFLMLEDGPESDIRKLILK